MDIFPPYAMRFMTDLEVMRMGGTNISCFPPKRLLSRLSKLRKLDLSGTSIAYLPPSVLFNHIRLEAINLSATPVSLSLDWSAHGLESAMFDWNRLVAVLPLLTSLNISRNSLTNAAALDLSN